jgi:predicted Zn-dependent peptidase
MAQHSQRGEKFDVNVEPLRQFYTEYFSGSMNSIVFQEMRERRGLAYSAWAGLNAPNYQKYNYEFMSYIATQNDKMMDAINAFSEIINEMPQSEPAFQLAKDALIARLRTDRITKSEILWDYIDAQDLGLTQDPRILFYEMVQKMTLQDVVDFQQKWVKNRTYHYAILGDKNDLNMSELQKLGPVYELTTEDIFGY